MIPRLHRRGNSFKGALGYVLHDVGKDSSERVAWVMTQNIVSHPEDAWFEMYDTYRNRSALKKYNGVDSRGRDNKTPVLHYTLAWHASDNPDPEHMKAMAVDSLKALGLSEHEAVMACHSDKEHHHVHVVVNTVHPYTGRTAALKFSKLEFSRWAEAYEKEHGIHCEQRIENNERRRELAKLREAEKEKTALALLTGKKPPGRAPYQAINDNSPNRRRWFERKEVVDRMKALHATLEAGQKTERHQNWQQDQRERADLDYATHDKLDAAREAIRLDFAKKWQALYAMQGPETSDLRKKNSHPFERAVFVFKHRARLAGRGEKLTMRHMILLILSGKKLKQRVERIHWREKRAIAREEKRVTAEKSEQVWQMHRAAFHALRHRQQAARKAVSAHHKQEHKGIDFAKAKNALIREREANEPLVKPPSVPKPEPSVRRASEDLKKVPIAPKREAKPQEKTIDPRSVLMRGEARHVGKAPIAEPKKETKQPEPKKGGKLSVTFKEALAAQRKKMDSKAREEFMKKTMAEWKRRRAKDDFERER